MTPPPARFLTLSQIKKRPAAAPGVQRQAASFMVVFRVQLLYLADLGQPSVNPSLLKGQRKTESPCRSFHPSLISAFSPPFSLSDSLYFFFPACLCVSFPLSFHSSELNAAWSANRLSPLIFSFFPPHSSLSSCAFLRLSLSPLVFFFFFCLPLLPP